MIRPPSVKSLVLGSLKQKSQSHAGQPCKPGWSAEQTGCIPAQGDATQIRKPSTQTQQKQPARRVGEADAQKLFGNLDDGFVVSLLGMEGAKVVDKSKVMKYEPGAGEPDLNAYGVEVQIEHPNIKVCVRFIGVDSQGRKFIKNEVLRLKEGAQGSGFGTKVFSDQVLNAIKEGYSYISTHAAGSADSKQGFNGYYTWPRLGYDSTIEEIDRTTPKIAEAIRQKFPEAKSVLDVLETSGGREWWKANGEDLYDARFDLTEGSRSREILMAYLEERQKRKVA